MQIIGAVALAALSAAGLLKATPASLAGSAAQCAIEAADYRALAAEAGVWGYPLIRSAQLRQNMTLPEEPLRPRSPSVAGAPMNRIGHARELADARTRQGVAPNNDTLYSVAWIDTASGPYVFETPDFGQRYYTIQIGLADTTTELALGQSTHGGQLPPLLILGPDQRAKVPNGMLTVRSPQRYLMIAGRTLVKGASDLDEARSLQNAMRLRRLVDLAAGREVPAPIAPQRLIDRADPLAVDGPAFLEMLGVVLNDWRASPADAAMLRRIRPLGIAAGSPFDRSCLGERALAQIEEGMRQARNAIERRALALGASVNGWTVNYQGARFAGDHLLRAAVARDQIYVLPAAEALYMNAKFDRAGDQLDGRRTYVLRFEKDQLPPVRFFWSATMYYAKGFLVPNKIERYSIGDRTPDLIRGPDGSIEILLQNDRPKNLHEVNWLPAPDGPFILMLRLYGPRPAIRRRAWEPPALVPVLPR